MAQILGHYRKVYPSSPNLEFFYRDNLGSLRTCIDCYGTKRDGFTYYSWGKVDVENGSLDSYLASFTGKNYDATGFIYFNHRYYDSTIGIFITEDPSMEGTAWYVYCSNNPINYTDENGRWDLPKDTTFIQGDFVVFHHDTDQISNKFWLGFKPQPGGFIWLDAKGTAKGKNIGGYRNAYPFDDPSRGSFVWKISKTFWVAQEGDCPLHVIDIYLHYATWSLKARDSGAMATRDAWMFLNKFMQVETFVANDTPLPPIPKNTERWRVSIPEASSTLQSLQHQNIQNFLQNELFGQGSSSFTWAGNEIAKMLFPDLSNFNKLFWYIETQKQLNNSIPNKNLSGNTAH
jgi:RHS repeat-associated protein